MEFLGPSPSLPSFYPLAGRLEENFVVDCNNAGVEFIIARVHTHLIDVIQQPDMEKLKQYLPLGPTAVRLGEDLPLLLVQITLFGCGGVAVGACFSHQIADCASLMAFFNAWATTCRGEPEVSQLRLDTASYFPVGGLPITRFRCVSISNNDKLMAKRFVFDEGKLAFLKRVATSPSGSTVKDPTRVELVSACIWKHFIELSKLKNLQGKKFVGAFHTVNLMRRITSPPQLLENFFGNCVVPALAISDMSCVEDLHHLVGKLRSSIRRIRYDYIMKPENEEDGFLNDLSKLFSLLKKGDLEWCTFSSWCGFPMYDVDYGGGNPIWFSTTAFPLQNLLILVSSRSGDGIEAIVTMMQDNLEIFEKQINNSFLLM